eukprot:scaffold10805_cov88-Skeletonema_marinoi.AAC.1
MKMAAALRMAKWCTKRLSLHGFFPFADTPATAKVTCITYFKCHHVVICIASSSNSYTACPPATQPKKKYNPSSVDSRLTTPCWINIDYMGCKQAAT